ncbi:MAG TPA: STAS domain-containing protein [Candidatus Sulfotelmatobacter sp.]|nr:STAS domain-containing protein [Candidatus Sulfotelmatobacter sp.]
MRVEVTTRQVGDVAIVDLRGRLVVGEESAAVRRQVRDLLLQGNKKLLLNLSQVDYIDSSGLGDLVGAFSSARKQGGELKLLCPGNKFDYLMQITKLALLIDVMDDEASAVKSFGQSTAATA